MLPILTTKSYYAKSRGYAFTFMGLDAVYLLGANKITALSLIFGNQKPAHVSLCLSKQPHNNHASRRAVHMQRMLLDLFTFQVYMYPW